MTMRSPARHGAPIIVVTGDDDRYAMARRKSMDLAAADGHPLILYDWDAPSFFGSPLPTWWSGEGSEDLFSRRLDQAKLRTAGRAKIADQVAEAEALGIAAYGWLPSEHGPTPRAEGELVLDGAPDHRGELTGDRLNVRPFFRDVSWDRPGVLAPCAGSLIPAVGHVNLLICHAFRLTERVQVPKGNLERRLDEILRLIVIERDDSSRGEQRTTPEAYPNATGVASVRT